MLNPDNLGENNLFERWVLSFRVIPDKFRDRGLATFKERQLHEFTKMIQKQTFGADFPGGRTILRCLAQFSIHNPLSYRPYKK
jgi:hypothetical protein